MHRCILFLAVLCAVSSGQNKILDIYPDPRSEVVMEGKPPVALGAGMRSLESGMTLLIHRGTHTVPDLTFVRDLSNVVLQGIGLARETTITCSAGVGLAFFNISNLRIRNVTITGCGLNQEHWDTINATLYNTFDMVFEIPRAVHVSILLAACEDVTLENFVVERTQGIGLLAMSLLGSTQLTNVRFQNNYPPACPLNLKESINQNFSNWIGGGAYFLYQDLTNPVHAMEHTLTIDSGEFVDNRDCSVAVLVENFIDRSAELLDLGYQVGAGGGLTVMMAQLRYSVAMSVTDSDFSNNVARSGSGVHVGVFSGVPPPTTIQFHRCMFTKNGRDEIVSSGGGMIINIDLVRPSELRGENHIEDVEGSVYINVERTTFVKNNANSGGGAAIISHHAQQHAFDSSYQASFDGCRFVENQGFGGAALLVYEKKHSGFESGLQLHISGSRFVRNSIELNNDVEVGHILDHGALHVRNVNLTLSGENVFERNFATALGSVSSLVNVRGMVRFYRNRAVQGAAMQLVLQSLLVLKSGADIHFRENRAYGFGGAIFVQLNPDNFTFIPDDCFLYFNEPGYGLCTNPAVCLPNNVRITFENNAALVGGMVYGSALLTCPWLHALYNSGMYDTNVTVYENLHRFSDAFTFTVPPDNPSEVSTETRILKVTKDKEISVMPGELFEMGISALDAFNRPIPEVITSDVIGNSSNAISVVGDFGFFEVRPMLSTQAPIMVLGGEGEKNITVRLSPISFRSEVFFNIRLTECVIGFNHSEQRCVCDKRLLPRGVSCDTNFTVGRNSWLGPVSNKSNITNDALTVAMCVLNYCEDGTKEVRSGEWDSQCRDGFHRAGLLCGRCEDGYSLQLGTNGCARCTNWSLFLLILFVVAGIFVVFVMSLLQISIAEGFLTAIIFYSNIITLYAVFFNDNKVKGINFFTSFLSLNFGIPACFYDGMDALAILALQLVFVGYVFFLAIVRIFLDKRIRFKWTDDMDQKYSPSKMFATLIIISYVSILQSSFGILSFTIVSSFDGHRHVLWYIDPTVPYFQGFHAFLCIVAVILVFLFILPLPFLLTFCSRAIYRWRYFNKLKPLYDALYAPFKGRHRPWLGFQLIVRIVLFFVAYFAPTPHQLLALGICLLVYIHLLTICQPYISWWVNLLESTLITNALLYVVVTLYFGNLPSVGHSVVLSTVAVLSLMGYCIIIAGFITDLIERYPKMWGRVKNIFKKTKKEEIAKVNGNGDVQLTSPMHPHIRVLDSIGNEVVESHQHRAVRSASVDYLNTITDQDRGLLAQQFEVSYTEFREPLLDEGNLEVHSSYSVVISSKSGSSAPGTPTRSSSPAHVSN